MRDSGINHGEKVFLHLLLIIENLLRDICDLDHLDAPQNGLKFVTFYLDKLYVFRFFLISIPKEIFTLDFVDLLLVFVLENLAQRETFFLMKGRYRIFVIRFILLEGLKYLEL